MKTEPRYYVHTVSSGVGNKIRNPHKVVDRTTGEFMDEFASKKAALAEARDWNDEDAIASGEQQAVRAMIEAQAREEEHPAPATDANGNDRWNIWASLTHASGSVTVTTDSFANRSAIGNFLLDEGYTVYAD